MITGAQVEAGGKTRRPRKKIEKCVLQNTITKYVHT